MCNSYRSLQLPQVITLSRINSMHRVCHTPEGLRQLHMALTICQMYPNALKPLHARHQPPRPRAARLSLVKRLTPD